MRIVSYFGHWICNCGKESALWDTCACGQVRAETVTCPNGGYAMRSATRRPEL